MPLALYALAAGAFGIGVTEFVIMGLLLEVSRDLGVSVAAAGMLISGYALGVVVGAPILTVFTATWNRKRVLIGLMVIFIIGNAACALAPSYDLLMAARILTALAHGTYFGVGSVFAASMVGKDKQASAIAIMFTGLTLANILGVPAGTWLGQQFSWRMTFWAVTLIGLAALAVLILLVPTDRSRAAQSGWRADLKAVSRASVLLGFLTTVLGFAGVFTLFTYIAPLLTQVSGFADTAVSPILLIFGGGLVAGNLLGGKLADIRLKTALIGSMAALALVLAVMSAAFGNQTAAVVLTGLLGVAGFATVPPLQSWVLSKAVGAGESLASSLNIAAFNLGNALGAWAGGLAISRGPGLENLPLVAAGFPLLAIVVALASFAIERRRAPSPISTHQTAS
ncbi:Inner membrane transport protein YdhP [Labrenzia sp. THAF191b]|uniref:MFS transporter n=1 Tax=unclassified Labrenzia TaxID=2648686 RepID=UPI001269783E|nr:MULTISPECIES: MFS transporter [unclassified Labrenzia]QFS96386.1 Inner membrane transport protein YdhP [Labrenzia sp. THAF191b]QFT02701.1 Inner membrane transport protein YdhP [Labrenzia sp. THAF191a]QFT14243.1 Inner membrane transport protein YdhP [Labrenzia sp. THAF187b]